MVFFLLSYLLPSRTCDSAYGGSYLECHPKYGTIKIENIIKPESAIRPFSVIFYNCF